MRFTSKLLTRNACSLHFLEGQSISVALASHTRELEVEADIFSGIPRDGKQNRDESRDWDGRRKNLIGSGRGPGIVMIPNFTHKYTFYINKL